jgi:hypothetical protein
MNVNDASWDGEIVEVFKVFTFGEPGGKAVLLQDCASRDDAMAYLETD